MIMHQWKDISNTLKNELPYHYSYDTEEKLYNAIEEFVWCLLQPQKTAYT